MAVAQIPHFLLGFTLQSVVSLAPVTFLVFPADIEGCGGNDDTNEGTQGKIDNVPLSIIWGVRWDVGPYAVKGNQ
jgi:hypothetical protein